METPRGLRASRGRGRPADGAPRGRQGRGRGTVEVVNAVNRSTGADPPGSPIRTSLPPRAGVRRGLLAGVRALVPVRLVVAIVDFMDERVARRHRRVFGRRRLLLSWQREPDGRWKARLSGPGLVHTIERTGRSRRRAIARAA